MIALPVTPAQYLFRRHDGTVELWSRTPSGWFDAGGIHYESPLDNNPRLTQWEPVEQYPTLEVIGLAPQLAELERICAESRAGKHKDGSIVERGEDHHYDKAVSHIDRWVMGQPLDPESGASHLIHAAARLLMAAACWDGER